MNIENGHCRILTEIGLCCIAFTLSGLVLFTLTLLKDPVKARSCVPLRIEFFRAEICRTKTKVHSIALDLSFVHIGFTLTLYKDQ